jgi:hypothetical protein
MPVNVANNASLTTVLQTLKYLVLTLCILVLLGCERSRVRIPRPEPIEPIASEPSRVAAQIDRPFPAESSPATTYTEAVSRWKTYEDLVKWMGKEFSLDIDRFRKFEKTLPPPRTPEETFRLKSGIYIDAAIFAKETLNRINPSYQARIVTIIMRPSGYNHYVCSFRKDGKLFIMDYGTPYKAMTGVHGPFNSLEGYREFYAKNHPIKRPIEAVIYLK